jgi:predicted nucleic acid-binding protein
MDSVMLDTSFCIRLLKKDDEYHKNVVEYFEYFLNNKIELYLSTIAVAEYSVKDDPQNLPMRTMKIVPFDFFDGKRAGEFFKILMENKSVFEGTVRDVIKDDCKILAQIANRNIEGYITKDKSSFNKIINPILNHTHLEIELLDLAIPLSTYKNELPFPEQ